MTYTIKIGLKKYRGVKGHYFPNDLPEGMMVIVMKNEAMYIVNTNKVKKIKICNDFFMSKLTDMKKESNGVMNESMINSEFLHGAE